MRSLGIRASDKCIYFSVVEKNDNNTFKILNIEEIKVPLALDFPSQLKYIRNTVLDILHEYGISNAGVRIAEEISENKSNMRIQIEGIIQEAFATSDVDSYFVAQSKKIIAKLKPFIKSNTKLKDLTASESKCDFIENWELCTNSNKKESVLVGVSALL